MTAWTEASGASSSVSRVAGPPPRTSTAADRARRGDHHGAAGAGRGVGPVAHAHARHVAHHGGGAPAGSAGTSRSRAGRRGSCGWWCRSAGRARPRAGGRAGGPASSPSPRASRGSCRWRRPRPPRPPPGGRGWRGAAGGSRRRRGSPPGARGGCAPGRGPRPRTCSRGPATSAWLSSTALIGPRRPSRRSASTRAVNRGDRGSTPTRARPVALAIRAAPAGTIHARPKRRMSPKVSVLPSSRSKRARRKRSSSSEGPAAPVQAPGHAQVHGQGVAGRRARSAGTCRAGPPSATRCPATPRTKAAGSSGLTSLGSCTSTRANVRPGMRSASWRRIVSTSGSSGTAAPLRQHQRRSRDRLLGDPQAGPATISPAALGRPLVAGVDHGHGLAGLPPGRPRSASSSIAHHGVDRLIGVQAPRARASGPTSPTPRASMALSHAGRAGRRPRCRIGRRRAAALGSVQTAGIALPGPRPSARPPPARRPTSAPRTPARAPRPPRTTPAASASRAATQDRQVAQVVAARRRAAPRPPRPTSSALPTHRPSGWSMSLTSQRTGRPQGSAMRRHQLGGRRGPRPRPAMNAPLPALTSSTHGARAARELALLMIEAATRPAERDGAGGVAQREQALARRGSGARPGQTTAIPDVAHLAHEALQGKVGLEAGDRLQLVDRAAGVGLARGRPSWRPAPPGTPPAARPRGASCPPPRRWSAGRRSAPSDASSRRSPGGDQRAREAPRRWARVEAAAGRPPCTRPTSGRRRPCRRATSARRTRRSRRRRGPRAGFARSTSTGARDATMTAGDSTPAGARRGDRVRRRARAALVGCARVLRLLTGRRRRPRVRGRRRRNGATAQQPAPADHHRAHRSGRARRPSTRCGCRTRSRPSRGTRASWWACAWRRRRS